MALRKGRAHKPFSKAQLGSGMRFKICVRRMMSNGYSRKAAEAICAKIGRNTYGKRRMAQLSAKGRKK